MVSLKFQGHSSRVSKVVVSVWSDNGANRAFRPGSEPRYQVLDRRFARPAAIFLTKFCCTLAFLPVISEARTRCSACSLEQVCDGLLSMKSRSFHGLVLSRSLITSAN